MKGSLFAVLAGGFITLQSVANTHISGDIGTWQTAMLTQLTGFLAALLILVLIRDRKWRSLGQVKPLYLIGGCLGAIIIFSNVKAIQEGGVTLTISAVLIAQLCLTFLIDSKGWFGVVRQKMKLPHFVGLGLMLAGVIILRS